MSIFYPIALTRPDWGVFSQATEDLLNQKITKALDNQDISLDDPGAFLAATEHIFSKPLADAQHLVCLSCLDSWVIIEITSWTALKVVSLDEARGSRFVMISGTMDIWLAACLRFCQPKIEFDIIDPFSQLVRLLKGTSLRKIFCDYSIVEEEDNTIHLVRK